MNHLLAIFLTPFIFVATAFGWLPPEPQATSTPPVVVQEEAPTTTPDIIYDGPEGIIYAPVINGVQTTKDDWEYVPPKKSDCLFATMPNGAVVDTCTGAVVVPAPEPIAPAQTVPLPQPVEEVTPPTSSPQSLSTPAPIPDPVPEPKPAPQTTTTTYDGETVTTAVVQDKNNDPVPLDPHLCDGSSYPLDPQCETLLPEVYAATVKQCEEMWAKSDEPLMWTPVCRAMKK